MLETLVKVDIMFPPTKVGQEILSYIHEYTPLPKDYIVEGTGRRIVLGTKMPEEMIMYMLLRWPKCVDRDVDEYLHGRDAWYNRK